ncbi:hypothetical protein Slin14017_G129830 [Septoria linicola]|nr:hypothetical protein Slin14017_G129830 [Septoria linicola]
MSTPTVEEPDRSSVGTLTAPPSYEVSIDFGQIIKDTGDGMALLRRDVYHLKANAEVIPQLQSSMSNLEQNMEDLRVTLELNVKVICDRLKVPHVTCEQVRTKRVQEEAAQSQGSRWQRRIEHKTHSSEPMRAVT